MTSSVGDRAGNDPEGLPASTLDRISLLLDSFRGSARLTLTELSRRTGIPRSTTHRMLDHLVRIGWLSRIGAEYELGHRLVEVGALAVYRNRLDRAVDPLLRELHHATGHVVHLGVLDGSDVVYIEKIGGRSVPELSTRVGTRIPARSSTIGKALLTTARRTARGPLGVAFGTCSAKVGCIGVRVGSLDGVEVGLSISGPLGRVRFDDRDAAPVRLAAVAIGQLLDLTGVVREESVCGRG
ncbi:winged helix-turn-helix transcriptional regulator [Prescottella agglutinans]|uniref:Winged helix-turn-helix transcriptional regulator n=1 Tax=Prescottella agglutinans TaxID=1644129 RepID=A0A438BG38_9NOCA|nr:helix-turn-helix domain-containing protein [Prescottella agglutinans]RVW09944.1 winged helix-turn-helix transcriptional regulator [Prescottella agglutinans]